MSRHFRFFHFQNLQFVQISLFFLCFFFSDDLKYLWLETWKFDCSEALGALWYSMFSHMTISGFETFKKYYLKETMCSLSETDL